MYLEFEFKGVAYSIEGEFVGTARPWDGKYEKYHFHVTLEGESKKFAFSYYTQKAGLNEEDLICALYCAATDASCYEDFPDFWDFAKELGYDLYDETIRSQAIKAHHGCKKMSSKFDSMGISVPELLEFLQENYNV